MSAFGRRRVLGATLSLAAGGAIGSGCSSADESDSVRRTTTALDSLPKSAHGIDGGAVPDTATTVPKFEAIPCEKHP